MLPRLRGPATPDRVSGSTWGFPELTSLADPWYHSTQLPFGLARQRQPVPGLKRFDHWVMSSPNRIVVEMEYLRMPITYDVRNDGNRVLSVATGPVTETDLRDYQAALLSDARVKPGFDELFDATAAQESGLSEAVLRNMVEADLAHTEKLRGGKCAIVAQTGFAWAQRYVDLHKGPQNIMVFVNMEVARTWVGISETTGQMSQP